MSVTREELERRYADMLEHCFDFSPPDGWLPLVAELFEKLEAIGGVQISQVKQKFGTLEVYPGDLDMSTYRQVYDLIDEYRRRSRKICETCGSPGMVRNDGWIHVACDEHVRAA